MKIFLRPKVTNRRLTDNIIYINYCLLLLSVYHFDQAVTLPSRVSHPSQVVLPFPNWEPKEKPVKEDDVGPQVTHIYEVTVPHNETSEQGKLE